MLTYALAFVPVPDARDRTLRPAPMNALPPVMERRSASGTTFVLAVDPALPGFQGHFPGDPVLPGVIQVDWAARFGAIAFGELGRFLGVAQLKFSGIIRPGETVELSLEHQAGAGKLAFVYRAGTQRKSSGVLLFSER